MEGAEADASERLAPDVEQLPERERGVSGVAGSQLQQAGRLGRANRVGAAATEHVRAAAAQRRCDPDPRRERHDAPAREDLQMRLDAPADRALAAEPADRRGARDARAVGRKPEGQPAAGRDGLQTRSRTRSRATRGRERGRGRLSVATGEDRRSEQRDARGPGSTVVAVTLGLVALALLAPPPAARADADPPSDVLLLQDVYYPYHPATAPLLRKQLDDLTGRAKKAGFPIKVAIVAARADLGGVPLMFGNPRLYARFLESEIKNNAPQPLLTVMPNGYGTFAVGPKGAAIVAALPRPSGSNSADAMARGALTAVERLAAANGRQLDTAHLGSGRSPSKGSTPLVLIFVPLLLLAGAVLFLSRRQRRDP